MKTMLFLNDETERHTFLLQNPAPAETTLRESETVVRRNCDRWGHPCPGCVDHGVETKADFPSTSLAKK